MKGRFITLEGGEGAGKTTLLPHVENLLRAAGVPLIVTREPGGTPLAEQIREVVLAHHEENVPGEAETLLVFAARAIHLANRIRPALEAGTWVLCDRFTDATYAYQGGGRGVPHARIAALEEWIQAGLRPDLTLLLDVPVDVGLARANRRGPSDRFESERREFYERVRAAYLERARNDATRFVIIDAAQPLETVRAALTAAVKARLDAWKQGT